MSPEEKEAWESQLNELFTLVTTGKAIKDELEETESGTGEGDGKPTEGTGGTSLGTLDGNQQSGLEGTGTDTSNNTNTTLEEAEK